jgi:hypothetical protein
VELSRKDAGRLDEKLDAYVAAWRTAVARLGWSRFPRVLYAVGTLSRFPPDARKLFAVTRYEEVIPVLVGRQAPATVPEDDPSPTQQPAVIDPAELVLPQRRRPGGLGV